MTILENIQLLAKTEGITIGALEKKIGASKGVLSRAISNGTDIQAKWLRLIVENYPQYSGTWLLTGRGDMLERDSSTITGAKNVIGKNATIIGQQQTISETMVRDMLAEKDATIRSLLELLAKK